jgi:hypothetical protein
VQRIGRLGDDDNAPHIAELPDDDDPEVTEANARLIAAAPELLEMLRHLCSALDMSDTDHEAFTDSCADVVEHLWFEAGAARALLARVEREA